MALQVLQVQFTAEAGPKTVSFPAPASPSATVQPTCVKVTDNPALQVSIDCDPPVAGTPQWTVNVYASDVFTGVVTLLVIDL